MLLIRDIVLQAKYIGRNINNLTTSYGWVQKFFAKHPKLRMLFRKSKGLIRDATEAFAQN